MFKKDQTFARGLLYVENWSIHEHIRGHLSMPSTDDRQSVEKNANHRQVVQSGAAYRMPSILIVHRCHYAIGASSQQHVST
ncbi:hypothetical protein [Sutterella wadsworthensis]|uniref:hypothetical protein n=1 Tax=Sutterella wadsworthensis TaxID=40545 RepID=UPI003967BD84